VVRSTGWGCEAQRIALPTPVTASLCHPLHGEGFGQLPLRRETCNGGQGSARPTGYSDGISVGRPNLWPPKGCAPLSKERALDGSPLRRETCNGGQGSARPTGYSDGVSVGRPNLWPPKGSATWKMTACTRAGARPAPTSGSMDFAVGAAISRPKGSTARKMTACTAGMGLPALRGIPMVYL